MAHNIDTMAYYGERPWHGLGTELKSPATAEEAIVAAGLSWQVEKWNLSAQGMDLRKADVDKKKATVRADNGTVLGVVGENYQVIQNTEAFGFFDSIVGEKAAMYHTAGSLGKGERVWILAKLPGEIRVAKDDVTEKFLLLANSHDGTMALKMFFSPVRVVCQNTLNMSLADARDGISLRHSGDINRKIEQARKLLGITVKLYDEFEEMAQALVKKQMTEEMIRNFLKKVVPVKGDELTTRGENIRVAMWEKIETGKGNTLYGVKGTAWAAINGVIEYLDHERTVKKDGGEIGVNELRLTSSWFGTSARTKAKAWDSILEVVQISRR